MCHKLLKSDVIIGTKQVTFGAVEDSTSAIEEAGLSGCAICIKAAGQQEFIN